jgi:DNA polymerase-3 subunit delta'
MFEGITGNQRVKELLQRMLEAHRLPDALLFSGPEGVGKKLFAFELAKSLNCVATEGVEPCGICPACKRISKINFPESEKLEDLKQIFWTDHPDVGFVQAPKRVFSVEQMRQIEREANYRPFEGKSRVFILDDADKLNEPSSNALLKTLEEPPPSARIILVTSRPAVLLPTIRSRCQAIAFSPLTADEIEQHLVNNKLASPAEARIRARIANGSLGYALAVEMTAFEEQRRLMLDVLRALTVTGSRSELLRVAEKMNDARFKDDYESNLGLLEMLIRDAWVVSLGSNEQMVNADLRDELTRIGRNLNRQLPPIWLSEIEELRDQLTVNINRRVATDALFLSMASVR